MNMKQHLLSRSYDVNLYSQTWIDEVERVITFPLWDLSGRCNGYQQYRPDETRKRMNNPKESRYFTRLSRDKTAMFGLESLCFGKRYCFVVEGVFDATKLHLLGEPCVAVLSYDNPESFKTLRTQGLILIGLCDGDKSGLQLGEKCDIFYQCPEHKDIGDLSLNVVSGIIKECKGRINYE